MLFCRSDLEAMMCWRDRKDGVFWRDFNFERYEIQIPIPNLEVVYILNERKRHRCESYTMVQLLLYGAN
jgi:hypothetical protein